MKKLLLSAVLAVSLIIGTQGVINSCEEAGWMLQVSDWAKDEIDTAFYEGLIPENLIYDDMKQSISRGEFASVAVKLYEKVTGNTSIPVEGCPFTDIGSEDTDIRKAYNLGIVSGMTTTGFEPGNRITREQLATMLCRTFKKCAWDGWTLEDDDKYYLNYRGVDAFEDDYKISIYAYPSVYFMAKHGVIKGLDDGRFAPNHNYAEDNVGYATREQAIIMSLRCLNNIFTEDVISSSRLTPEIDYKAIYTDFVSAIEAEKNVETDEFDRGVGLVDLDDNGVPELFSISYYGKDFGYEFVDGTLKACEETTICTFSYDNFLFDKPNTLYEGVNEFCGVYINKITGEKALISYHKGDENNSGEFKLITFDGDRFHVQDVMGQSPSEVMQNYKLADEQMHIERTGRGWFRADTGVKMCINSYGRGGKPETIADAEDGSFYCYIENINPDADTISLIPALTVSYEEYQKGVDAFKKGDRYECKGTPGYVFSIPGVEDAMPCISSTIGQYYFYEPTENSDSIVYDYKFRYSVKAQYDENLKVRYTVLSYDKNGVPEGYESFGRNSEYFVEDYFRNFSELDFNSCYHAVVKDGRITELDVMYRP